MTGPDDLVARVLLPLVRGGTISVGAPVPVAVARRWALEADVLGPPELGSARAALALARARTAADLVAHPPSLPLSGDDVRAGVALHDALCAAHPRASEVTFARRVRARIVAHALALADASPARGRGPLLARHTLLARLVELGRTDRLVRWWTGDARFRGQASPARLRALPRLRRVREERVRVPLVELLRADDGVPQAAIAALYASSPLTDLLEAGRGLPTFRWGHATAALAGDAELIRAVLYRWLGDAPTADALAGAPAAAAAALLPLLDRPGPDVARLCGAIVPLLVHVTVLVCAGEPDAFAPLPGPARRAGDDRTGAARLPACPQSIEDALERLGRRPDEGLATLLALPVAAGWVVPALALPPGLDGAPALAARLAAARTRVQVVLGDDAIRRLAARLAHALDLPAPSPDRC